MILKKPYAFLIKHFKLIHIILTIPLIYIVTKSRTVVTFFNEYVLNKYTFQTGNDISAIYVSGLMLFAIFVIIIAALTIYFLLKYKEKPVKMYIFIIVYYITLFIVLFWLSGVISSMSRDVLSAKAARLYRDIATIIYYPQYIFIVFVFLRAIGFNIKQFNFKSDLKELEITSADSEEVEVGFEIDGYKTKRFFRRFKREFGYYLVENKFMVTIIVIIIIFSSILIYYNTRKSYNSTYTQSDNFVHQGFSLSVKDSIITNLSYDGKKFDNNYYLAIKMNVTNAMGSKSRLNTDSYVVTVGDKQLKPLLDRSTYFLDYASPYYGEYIRSGVTKDFVLVYKLDKKDLKKEFKLKVLSSFKLRDDKLVTNYSLVDLTPVILDEVTDIKSGTLNTKMNFNNTNVGSTILTIKSYEIGKSYTYDYKVCKNDNDCMAKKDVVSVNYNIAKKTPSLLILDYDIDIDRETSYANSIKRDSMFFENFFKIKAGNNGYYNEYSVVDVTPKNLENKLVLQFDGDITGADDVDFVITIRNKRYIINII